jgi:cell division septal protein FtsQ
MNIFGRSNENRRRPKGGTVLQAKLSADASSEGNPRLRRWILRTSVTLVLAASVATGGWWVREHWINRIPALAIREVVVEVDGVLSPDEVRRLAGVPLGRNILSVDLPQLRDRLQNHPRISSARIIAEFPGSLLIRVRERLPLVAVEPLAKNGLQARYLLDETGHLLLPLDPSSAPAEAVAAETALPVLLGYQAQRPTAQADTLRALEFLKTYESVAPGALPDIRSISIAEPGVLVVTTDTQAEVTFAARDYGTQLQRWSAILGQLRDLKESRTIQSLDLSVSQNSPIRWNDSPSTTPSSEAHERSGRPKPKRIPRRSHV